MMNNVCINDAVTSYDHVINHHDTYMLKWNADIIRYTETQTMWLLSKGEKGKQWCTMYVLMIQSIVAIQSIIMRLTC